jgi:hypothetical protein
MADGEVPPRKLGKDTLDSRAGLLLEEKGNEETGVEVQH